MAERNLLVLSQNAIQSEERESPVNRMNVVAGRRKSRLFSFSFGNHVTSCNCSHSHVCRMVLFSQFQVGKWTKQTHARIKSSSICFWRHCVRWFHALNAAVCQLRRLPLGLGKQRGTYSVAESTRHSAPGLAPLGLGTNAGMPHPYTHMRNIALALCQRYMHIGL